VHCWPARDQGLRRRCLFVPNHASPRPCHRSSSRQPGRAQRRLDCNYLLAWLIRYDRQPQCSLDHPRCPCQRHRQTCDGLVPSVRQGLWCHLTKASSSLSCRRNPVRPEKKLLSGEKVGRGGAEKVFLWLFLYHDMLTTTHESESCKKHYSKCWTCSFTSALNADW